MAEIPAPLASRHTATGVLVLSVLAAVAAIAVILVPADWPFALVLLRQVVLALHAVVLAVAVVIVWRTLAKRSMPVALGSMAATAGLLLLAVAHAAWTLEGTDWGVPVVITVLAVAYLGAAALVAVGFLVVGAALVRRGLWRGPTRGTLLIAGIATVGVIGTAVLAPGFAPIAYAVWVLVLIGLAAGLRTPREVANAGVPQGAALTPIP